MFFSPSFSRIIVIIILAIVPIKKEPPPISEKAPWFYSIFTDMVALHARQRWYMGNVSKLREARICLEAVSA